MLKPANRLKSKGEFKRTLTGRRLCSNHCFVLYGLAANPNAAGSFLAGRPSQPRVGFIVSKKVHKRSTKRNRIRRRLRELVRLSLLHQPDTPLTKYRSLVFIARTGSLDASFENLRHQMERCFRNL